MEEIDDGVWGFRIEFGGIGFLHAQDVLGEFDDGKLHAKANPKEGDLVFPGVTDGEFLAVAPSMPEASGDEDAVDVFEEAFLGSGFDLGRGDPFDVDVAIVVIARGLKGLGDGKVSIVELDVFANESDRDALLEVFDLLHQRGEVGKVGLIAFGWKAEMRKDEVVDSLPMEIAGELIDDRSVIGFENAFQRHVAEQRDLFLGMFVQRNLGTEDDRVRLQAQRSHFLNRMLSGLGFGFSGGLEVRD